MEILEASTPDNEYTSKPPKVKCARRYLLFHNKRHHNEMSSTKVTTFLTHLAVE
jgi:hypothetical protein